MEKELRKSHKQEKMSDYFKKNSEGYPDPTAHAAVKHIEEEYANERDRLGRLLKTICYICEIAGFQIEGRIVLKDKRTGRTWH